MLDHRAGAPGPSMKGPNTRKGLYESAVVTCSHCQYQIVLRPERTREREWCWTCDHYICDRCAAVRKVVGCKTFKQILDEQEALIIKQEKVGT